MIRTPFDILFAVAGSMTSFVCNCAFAQSAYSLKSVEASPIPKAEHFQLWKEAGLAMCSEELWTVRMGLTVHECRATVAKRADQCALQLANESPDVVNSTAVSKQIARVFLNCAMPYPQCKGTEVKTEAEARQQCR